VQESKNKNNTARGESMEAVSSEDFSELESWTDQNQGIFPGKLGTTQKQLLSNYRALLKDRGQSLQNLKLLRQAMGMIPKSEKGNQEKHANAI
jgi:hypothetical protein